MVDLSRVRLLHRDRLRLVGFYQDAMRNIAESISKNTLASATPRLNALLSETRATLKALDAKAAEWIEKEISALYRGNLKWTDRWVRSRGVTLKRVRSAAEFSKVHESVIRDLITNPATGLGPRLQRLSDQLGISVKSYVQRHKVLLQQTRTVNRTLAEGVLRGASAADTRAELLKAFGNKSPRTFLGFERDLAAGRVYQPLLDAPFIKIPTAKGVRRVHISDHLNSIAVTKESEVRTRARNERALERGIDLVRITPNPPLTPDACALYAGRVFSLTDEARERTNYPLLSSLPNGGPPFHPFCTHSTIPWIEEVEDEEEVFDHGEKRTKVAANGLPEFALSDDFGAVQKQMKKKGGFDFAVSQNPQLKKQRASSFADPSVVKALE